MVLAPRAGFQFADKVRERTLSWGWWEYCRTSKQPKSADILGLRDLAYIPLEDFYTLPGVAGASLSARCR